jgi:hypothetical protein
MSSAEEVNEDRARIARHALAVRRVASDDAQQHDGGSDLR